MWKKIMTSLLAGALICSLAACGTSAELPAEEGQAASESAPESVVSQSEETASEKQEDAPEQKENVEAPPEDASQSEGGMKGPGGNGGPGGRGGSGGGPGGMSGGMGVSNDEEIQAVLDENADKFEQFTYEDAETGVTLEYSLYIPEEYDGSQSYPLILFIPDSTGSGKSAQEIVEQYYGATVWVTEEDQAKHASFVLVPAFSETVVDDNWNVSEQVEAAVNLLEDLQNTYNIDADRLYTTGQSMGCMTSLYLNSKYPDLFAASLFVSGQWDSSVLQPLENATFFYVVAGGDEKASGGQNEVMAMFDEDGAAYTYDEWNAQDGAEEQDAAVEAMLAAGTDANMIRFEAGSVFQDGQSGMEHMASFNYGYKLTAVRDWLFEQSR